MPTAMLPKAVNDDGYKPSQADLMDRIDIVLSAVKPKTDDEHAAQGLQSRLTTSCRSSKEGESTKNEIQPATGQSSMPSKTTATRGIPSLWYSRNFNGWKADYEPKIIELNLISAK